MAEVPDEKDGQLVDGMVVDRKLCELYYFAYGSNMNKEQIFARCAQPKVVAVAKLPRYQVAFYGYSKVWDGAVETVIPASDLEVWGVIYDLSSSDRDRLDDWQDARLDGSGAYFHYPARVTDKDGKIYNVLLYKKDNLGIPQKPSQEYLNFIIQGAVDHELPSGYLETLWRIESRKAEFNVPRQKPSSREPVSGGDCSQCGDVQDSVINISLGSRSHS
jgi:gamma-glutamylcyclotransferase